MFTVEPHIYIDEDIMIKLRFKKNMLNQHTKLSYLSKIPTALSHI